MKVLVIGGGGREHVLTWALARDSRKPFLFIAPGNAGTAELGTNLPIDSDDVGGLLEWAHKEMPDLTVVGPEAPLCAGIVDRFQAEGFRIFGPSQAAARLEGSKAFAKDVMRAGDVPTAWAARFTELDPALACVRERGAPIVIKADGLAAGKGVTVATSMGEAETALRQALEKGVFGEAGSSVLVEECLEGEEASILGLVDGDRVELLASSQDHKRAREGDQGPNTGGMGAYSPTPLITDDLWPVIREQVFDRTLAELKHRGIAFHGVLYAGLMITQGGPKVLEYNVRFGDPECQCILPRIRGDIIPLLEACIDGKLDQQAVEYHPGACVCVVMAAEGYPGAYEKGQPIDGLSEAAAQPEVAVFHAGTALHGDSVVTSGGRVLGVSALGGSLEQAIQRAYQTVDMIGWNGIHVRRDIGAKATGYVG